MMPETTPIADNHGRDAFHPRPTSSPSTPPLVTAVESMAIDGELSSARLALSMALTNLNQAAQLARVLPHLADRTENIHLAITCIKDAITVLSPDFKSAKTQPLIVTP